MKHQKAYRSPLSYATKIKLNIVRVKEFGKAPNSFLFSVHLKRNRIRFLTKRDSVPFLFIHIMLQFVFGVFHYLENQYTLFQDDQQRHSETLQ